MPPDSTRREELVLRAPRAPRVVGHEDELDVGRSGARRKRTLHQKKSRATRFSKAPIEPETSMQHEDHRAGLRTQVLAVGEVAQVGASKPPMRAWPRAALRSRFSRTVAFLSSSGPARAISFHSIGLGLQLRRRAGASGAAGRAARTAAPRPPRGRATPRTPPCRARCRPRPARRGWPAAAPAEHVAGLAVALPDAAGQPAVEDEAVLARALDRHADCGARGPR